MSNFKISDLPSRFFLAPINTGYSDNGVPTSQMLAFHKRRTGHKIGVAYVGNVAIASDYKTNDGTAVITKEHLRVWHDLARCIREGGSIPAIQLACRLAPRRSSQKWVCR